jgi:type I restriction enzyme M protein
MATNSNQIENRLWAAADELRANSKLKSSEYAVPVLGLIFLRYADQKFSRAEKQVLAESMGRRKIGPADYQAKGVLYLPEEASKNPVAPNRWRAGFSSAMGRRSSGR